jgi:O-antigen/teichoic acid export membrane protein
MIRRALALRHDRLVTNSFYITLSNASMGILGFLFWIVATRLYHPDQVGVATTLVSAGVLIASAGQMGFNISFVRFLPASGRRSDEINSGLAIVFLSSVLIGAAYVTVVPSFVPQLGFLHANWWQAAAIVVFVAFGAVNVVTDSVFIAFREARFNVVVDGLLQGSTRLALPVAFVGLGAFGLMTAYGIASCVAVTASILIMMGRYSYRPRPAISVETVRRVFRFGATNYVAELFTMVPVLLLPLIIIHERGSAAAGYFYLALSVANMLFMAGQAVGQSLLAEGSNETASLRDLGVRAGRLQVVMLAMALLFMAAGHRILLVFGRAYASHATLALVVLLASTPAVGLRNWSIALLRLRHRLPPILAANLCLAVIPCLLAAVTARYGLVWVAVSWLIGNLVAGLVAAAALLPAPALGRRRPAVVVDR